MMNSIKETYRDFLAFLKRPTDELDPIQTRLHKTKRLFSLLAVDIPVMVIILSIIFGIEKLGLINSEEHKLTIYLQVLPLWLMILLGVIIIPLFEELIFRLYLRFKHNYLARLIILLASLTGKQNKIKTEINLATFWRKKFRSIFYLSALLFGVIHFKNYEYSNTILLLFPILLAPQFICGLFLGYLRVKYGFFLGYLMHALHNAIFLMIPLIFMSGAIEKLDIKTNEYSLKIEESSLRQKTSTFIDTDSIKFNGTSIKSTIALILEKDENYIESNNNKMAAKKNNLYFENYLKDNSDNKKVILNHLSETYDFKIESYKKQQEIWEIQIKDSIKLLNHKSNTIGNSFSIRVDNKKITLKNVDLNELANTITSNYNKYIINNTNNNYKFDFNIPSKDFTELVNVLDSIYGISLPKAVKELEFYNINFF